VNLWSYVQLAVLAALALAGSLVQVHHVDLAFRYDGDLEIDLDPIFLVRTDFDTARRFAGKEVCGFAFGNIAVVCEGLDPKHEKYVIAHELTHVLQCRALGPWFPFVYNINPRFFEPHLTDDQIKAIEALPTSQWMEAFYPLLLDSMWIPPTGWPPIGTFLRFPK